MSDWFEKRRVSELLVHKMFVHNDDYPQKLSEATGVDLVIILSISQYNYTGVSEDDFERLRRSLEE